MRWHARSLGHALRRRVVTAGKACRRVVVGDDDERDCRGYVAPDSSQDALRMIAAG